MVRFAANAPVDAFEFAMDGEVIRCSRHGWEFNIKTGECIGVDCAPKLIPPPKKTAK